MTVAEETVPCAAQDTTTAAPPEGRTMAPGELAAMAELLERLCAESARQSEYAKKQLRLTRLFAGACAFVLAVVLCVCLPLIPRVGAMLASVDNVMAQAQTVAANLETVSTQLAATDLSGMLENVDALVLQSQNGITKALKDMEEALKVIESFDIDTLNSSIQDLHNIINPLARLLGR